MSYCRFGTDSDVYVFKSGDIWICSGCKLTSDDSYFKTLKELREHLQIHEKAGHKVPPDVYERIEFEMNKIETIFGRPLGLDQISPADRN